MRVRNPKIFKSVRPTQCARFCSSINESHGTKEGDNYNDDDDDDDSSLL